MDDEAVEGDVLERHEFYIDGRWTRPVSGQRRELIDPSTEDACAVFTLGGTGDADAAVAAARNAFGAWSRTDPAERLACVRRMRDVYMRRSEDMARAISLEMGAPIDLARRSQAAAGPRHMTNFMAAFENFEFLRPLGPDAPDDRIALEPVGVAALITPWNWPMSQVTLKVVAAMLAGCTMVLKPSELAPLSSFVFAEIVEAAGVPPGVFNMVQGDGPGVGTRLSEHPDVDVISFTGSTRSGIAISKAAAGTLKRVCLELGGKGANLVFDDADEGAVERGVRHCFNNSGQSCNAPTRMLVQRSVYEQAVDTARDVARTIRVGSAHECGPHIGPVVSARQYARVQDLIRCGMEEGARLEAGGPGRPEGLDRGYFVRPTVFADVDNRMTIAREEIFGPVLSIIPFDDEEEAVSIANDTPYGLTNYVQSRDPAKCNRVARLLRSGMVEMNGRPRGAGSPFGGTKASGRAREGGRWGIEEFLEVKAISGWG